MREMCSNCEECVVCGGGAKEIAGERDKYRECLIRIMENPTRDSANSINVENNWTRWAKKMITEALE